MMEMSRPIAGKGVEQQSASNIDRFNEMVGLVFAYLYKNHPIRMTFDAKTFLPLDDDSAGVPPDIADQWDFFDATTHWLEQEGFIRIGTVSPNNYVSFSAFYDVGLTGQGLATLQRPAEAGKSLGAKIVDLSTDIGKDVAKDAAKGFLKQHGGDIAEVIGRLVTGVYKGFAG